jgi:hypothetical protein
MASHNLLLAADSHFAYTLTIKQIVLSTPHSKQTPTKPSPIKENRNEKEDFLQIDKIPPLFPLDGKKAQRQSSEPHRK